MLLAAFHFAYNTTNFPPNIYCGKLADIFVLQNNIFQRIEQNFLTGVASNKFNSSH